MPLAVGTRLGPYQILAAIGAGGMGEVYRARDTKLDRDVAIKILPDVFADDADRLARFEREAKTLAALNHPGIAAIYGFEANALVMELVEGEDLSAHIARGAIPLVDALPIAKQIVDALEAAHEQGIVHRDLKPANVKVRPDGTVKVLDFGLAKALAPDAASGATSPMNSPTMTARATQLGMIIGTAAYMAPEQARGRPVDRRADIWSFGVVLYEMLTGTRAFDGDDISITLASVLKEDVRWDALPADVPAPIGRLLRRCLEKDPKRRLRDIGEARLVLEDPAALEPAAVRRDGPAGPTSLVRRVLPWAVAAALATGLIVALVIWAPWARVPPPQPISFVVDPPLGESFTNGPGLVAISPDGRKIAFTTGAVAGSKLWIRPLESVTATLVASATGAWHPTWSPDGRSIVFAGSGGAAPLKRVDIDGGPALKLADSARERPAWNSADVILYTNGADGRLYRVAAAGGPSVPVTELDPGRQETTHAWPVFLSDGRRFIYYAESTDPARSALYLASLDSTERTHLVDVQSMGAVVPGFLIYGREGTLFAHPFDERTGRLTGDPTPVLGNVQFNAANGRVAFDVSPNGVLVYRAGASSATDGVFTWFDRAGKALATVGIAAAYVTGALSPDGERLVAPKFDTSRQHTDLFMLDLTRGVPVRFTSDAADELYPAWSPDGQAVVFSSNRKGVFDLFVKASGGATAERLLFESAEDKYPTGFSSDGKTLLFVAGPRGRSRLWALPMTGDPKPVLVFPGSSENELTGQFSPDGHSIAYVVAEGPGNGNVFVQPFPPNGDKTRISTTTGFEPMWTADGKQIVYMSFGTYLAVDVAIANGHLRAGLPKALFTHPQIGTALRASGFAMDPKGDRFLLLVDPASATQSAPEPLTVIVNWAAALGKRK